MKIVKLNAYKIIIIGLVMVLSTFIMQKAVGNTILVALKILEPEQGPPAVFFLISIGVIGFISGCLFTIAYLLIGQKLPIRNDILRSVVFGMFIYFSNYLAQSLGLLGAKGDSVVMTFRWDHAVFDFFAYIITFVICGLLFKREAKAHTVKIPVKATIITGLCSAVLFPLLMLAITWFTSIVIPSENIIKIIKVAKEYSTLFYIVFYSCFILTGALVSPFYILTENQSNDKNKHIRFALTYSFLIWLPIVCAMFAFGVKLLSVFIFEIESVIVFIVLMLILNLLTKFLNKKAIWP